MEPVMHTGMVTSNNIFIPSAHSVGESPSQAPGQMCSPRELVKPAMCSNTDTVFCMELK